MKLHRAIALMTLLAVGSPVAQEGPAHYRNPAVSATTIVFEFGGDHWSIP